LLQQLQASPGNRLCVENLHVCGLWNAVARTSTHSSVVAGFVQLTQHP